MIKKTLLVVLLCVIALGLASTGLAQAQQPSVSVTRSISPSSVPADGGEVTVTVRINGYQGIGLVEETLPTGFTYVDGSADITPTENGRKLSFPLVSETSFTYKVDTSSTAGQHPFSGELTYGIDKTLVTVGGDLQRGGAAGSTTQRQCDQVHQPRLRPGGRRRGDGDSQNQRLPGHWVSRRDAADGVHLRGRVGGHNTYRERAEVELSTRQRDIFHIQGGHLKHGRTASVLRRVDLRH